MLSVNQLRKRIKPVTGLKGKERFETIINNNYYRNKINKLQTHNNNMITKKAKLNIIMGNLKIIERIFNVKSSDKAVDSVKHQIDTIDDQNDYIEELKSKLKSNQSDQFKQTISKLKKQNNDLLNKLTNVQVKLDEYNKQSSAKVSNNNDDESTNPQANNNVDKQSMSNNNPDNPINHNFKV